MTPSYGFDREKKLIDDVRAPSSGRTESGFDVRSPKVKRHSIGYLDNQYTSRLRAFVKPVDKEDAIDKARGQAYTRVPPLATVGLPAFATATAAKARQSLLRWLPTKYTLRKGLKINWKTEVFPILKFVLPVIAVIIGLLIVLAQNSASPGNQAVHHSASPSPTHTASQTTSANNPGPSGTSSSASSPDTSATSTSNNQSGSSTGYSTASGSGSGSGSNSSAASQPATGGMGGGGGGSSGSSGSSSGSGSSGVTITTPPISVGSKQVLGPVTVDPSL